MRSKPGAKELLGMLAEVDAVQIDRKCVPNVRIDHEGFTEAHKRGTLSLYIRTLERK
jgi:hypothetical protein